MLHSNTTLVKVKLRNHCKYQCKTGEKIQHLLKLNISNFHRVEAVHHIQIQHLLKLNFKFCGFGASPLLFKYNTC